MSWGASVATGPFEPAMAGICLPRQEVSVSGRTPVKGALPPSFLYRPEIGRGYPLNLSISLSGGKETNKDSLSNGE